MADDHRTTATVLDGVFWRAQRVHVRIVLLLKEPGAERGGGDVIVRWNARAERIKCRVLLS